MVRISRMFVVSISDTPIGRRRGRLRFPAMDGDPAARLRTALELHELGVQMYRQRLRRERPELSDSALAAEVRAWLRTRPGAEHGDAVGRPSDRFR